MPIIPLDQKLREKGWSEEEIKHALTIIQGAPEETGFAQRMNPVLYWSALLISIIGNMLIAVVMIPFLLVLESYQLYIVIAVLAISFGAMFNLLIRTIEHVDPAHHIVAGVFIPALAVITVFVMVNVANRLSFVFQGPIQQNPVLVSVVYVVAFILPYSLQRLSTVVGRAKPL